MATLTVPGSGGSPLTYTFGPAPDLQWLSKFQRPRGGGRRWNGFGYVFGGS